MEHFDVIIVGAGLSGIGAAYHLQKHCPDRNYAILEAREAIGGTWDLFRYPGIRSDSDMFTLGYSFRPWVEAKAIADGPSILNYVRRTASDNGIDRHIRFGQAVVRASWSSAEARWTVETERGGEGGAFTCSFLLMCSGYYDYAGGHDPDFAGRAEFAGRIVHPQHWPDDLDYAGKRVVVIGSGATAVTIVPEMARTAAHVTMLQRSPTYVVSRPAEDRIANGLRRVLPAKLAYGLVRWKNVLLGMLFFNLARKRPEKTKAKLIGLVGDQLGPDYDVARHFTPDYNPWDQRLCLVPDADLFDAINAKRVSVVTDRIARFTPGGIRLESGADLPADVIVTATGLKLAVLGKAAFFVDGARVDFAKTISYKGMMFSGVPNLASAFGYTNASWTLKADLTSAYVCRLLNHMKARGHAIAMPTLPAEPMEAAPWLDFTSGYVQRSLALFPKQGTRKPWRIHQNYLRDLMLFRYAPIDDGAMVFSNPQFTSA
ncbi:flavin-containing monooxygenase [Sphingomonas flavalba]|uniref:flavin-containing monooxygenase n=1 Tax=Sphingomonas flavalba TaxID=2559804 RepID=UPI0039E038C0